MKPFIARYTLRNGVRGVLHVVAACSCDAIVTVLDTFGESLRSCSARRA
jgi:hypothetical protein